MTNDMTDLLIFTCEGREQLLQRTWDSFFHNCEQRFHKIIISVDGPFDEGAFKAIRPDVVIRHEVRRGYVNSIARALAFVESPYFFWLEDDWIFHRDIRLQDLLTTLEAAPDRCQVLLSQWTPLRPEYMQERVGENLFITPYGFSANPSLNRSAMIRDAFLALSDAPKGGRLGEHGFENFLSAYFRRHSIVSVISDPGEQAVITHDGYLESTPRNWHMTNSLEGAEDPHLLTIPVPPFWRRGAMMLRLSWALLLLSVRIWRSDQYYEMAFRILASLKTIRKHG